MGINERNVNRIANLLKTYGTDTLLKDISDAIQSFEDGERGAGDFVRALKRGGAEGDNTLGDGRSRKGEQQNSFGTGDHAQDKRDNADNQTELKTSNGTVYG